MKWLRKFWYARLRAIDLRVLWPACRERARDLDHAKAAFALHAMNDDAWLILGQEEVARFIDELV